jgi:hypothetical protein
MMVQISEYNIICSGAYVREIHIKFLTHPVTPDSIIINETLTQEYEYGRYF